MLGWLLVALVSVVPPPEADEPAPPLVHSPITAGSLVTKELHTPRFVIRYTPAAEGPARALARVIEPLRDEVSTVIGRDWPGITEVRLGWGREEYEALALPNGRPPSWAVALAYPEANIVLAEAHALSQGDGQLTLRHELVHVALGQLGGRWPRWFQEGLAMELTGERKFRLGQYAVLSRAVMNDRIFRFDDLGQGFPLAADDVEIAYAQSVAFVEFLSQRHGRDAFGVLIDRMQRHDEFEKAFGIAFHTSLSVEERLFRDELPRRYPFWPLVLSGGTLVWALASGLLVAAYVRRRRQVAAYRLEQARVERLEDLSELLVDARTKAANDDLEYGVWAPLDSLQGQWIVSSIRVVNREAAHTKGQANQATS